MNLKHTAATAALALSALSGAQQLTEQQRLDSIWYGATRRMSQECDAWYNKGEYLRCIQLLKMETTIFPYDFDSADLLGWFQESTDDEAGALATYISYRQNNPLDPDGPYMEALYYFRKRVYAKVPPLLEPTLKLTPHPHPNIYRELAHSYERLNLLADSKRVWKAYLALAPKDNAAKNNLERIEKKIKGQIPVKASGKSSGKA